MKSIRQAAILELIEKQSIETQGQLIEALRGAGIVSTQATVSRDIKELHIIKELAPDGSYRYAVLHKKEKQNHSLRLQAIFRECVTSCVCAQNIVVIKTLPGLAQAACSAIDSMNIESLAGTLGGDDTAFLCMYSAEEAREFTEEIREML
ncbi:MAG: arginine repressor [Oscillospiraceae bacterium]|nr:arginine repressor [Oscillospiraceae bacterium]